MSDEPAPQETSKSAKQHRTMVVTVVIALLGFVALVAFNMK
jgi:hypothetical protein